ncbi:hypothetical protein DL93DRAFT_562845 [Clavulina sp. PMI_390]|nr:hypothetical protein DL93DRAFT_562845 [Clavulina sp. PMI_390]
MSSPLYALLFLAIARGVAAKTCYHTYYPYSPYECTALSKGASIGVSVAVAVGVIIMLLISWRKRLHQRISFQGRRGDQRDVENVEPQTSEYRPGDDQAMGWNVPEPSPTPVVHQAPAAVTQPAAVHPSPIPVPQPAAVHPSPIPVPQPAVVAPPLTNQQAPPVHRNSAPAEIKSEGDAPPAYPGMMHN